MRWDEVHSIAFTKVDAIDSIITYLTFDYSWGEYVEVTDSMDGFEQLVSDLPKYLPTISLNGADVMASALPHEAPFSIYQRPEA